MITVNIKDFLLWGENPEKGQSRVIDSKIMDLYFEKDNQEYDVKTRFEVEYTRYYYPATQESPREDYYEIHFYDIDLIKGNNDKKELSEKDMRRLREYIIENIEFV